MRCLRPWHDSACVAGAPRAIRIFIPQSRGRSPEFITPAVRTVLAVRDLQQGFGQYNWQSQSVTLSNTEHSKDAGCTRALRLVGCRLCIVDSRWQFEPTSIARILLPTVGIAVLHGPSFVCENPLPQRESCQTADSVPMPRFQALTLLCRLLGCHLPIQAGLCTVTAPTRRHLHGFAK